jgi:hypothetical protein
MNTYLCIERVAKYLSPRLYYTEIVTAGLLKRLGFSELEVRLRFCLFVPLMKLIECCLGPVLWVIVIASLQPKNCGYKIAHELP